MLVFAFRSVRASLAFLTCIPVGGHPYAELESRWAVAHFPLVGAALGVVLGVLFWLGSGLGAFVGAVLVVLASMWITGALHEDGLADTADALFGATSRERVFEILKDSRIGTYGAAALFCSILLRVALLARLDALAPAALVLAHCAARLPPVALLSFLPYVTPGAQKSAPFSGTRGSQVAMAALWVSGCAGILVLYGFVTIRAALVSAAVLVFVGIACASWFRARVGGITGDFLGATEQVGENAILLVLLSSQASAALTNA